MEQGRLLRRALREEREVGECCWQVHPRLDPTPARHLLWRGGPTLFSGNINEPPRAAAALPPAWPFPEKLVSSMSISEHAIRRGA